MKGYLSLTLVLIMFLSCKKDTTNSNAYFFTFSIGSTTYSIDSATVHISTQNNSSSSFEIIGYTKSNLYSLNAFGNNPLDTNIVGTYLTTMSPSPKKLLTGGGFISNDVNDKNLGTYPVNYDGKYSFTISEKTDSYISGTFGGTLKSFSTQKEVTISNGRFKLPY